MTIPQNPTESITDSPTVKNIQFEIARLDRLLIFCLVRRLQYAYQIQQLQSTGNQALAIHKFRTMLRQRQGWAIAAGLSPNLVQKLTHYLIDYYLTEDWGSRG